MRSSNVSTLAAAIALASLAGDGAQAKNKGNGNEEKVWICHGTASETNPYVLIHVRESRVQGHLDHTAPGHHGEPSARPDFLWFDDTYDTDCNVHSGPVRTFARCGGTSGEEPLEAVTFVDGEPVSELLDCPAPSFIPLPEGTTHVRCDSGSEGAPYWQEYTMGDPTGSVFGVNCTVDDIVNLGLNGGPFQALCPDDGTVVRYHLDADGSRVEEALPCAPGSIAPSPDSAFDWSSGHVRGLVGCPTEGSLALHFLGDDTPTGDPEPFADYACTAGEPLDVTRAEPGLSVTYVACGGMLGTHPLELVRFDATGAPVSEFLDCPGHSFLPIPSDVEHIRCVDGSEALPYWQEYYFDEPDPVLGRNCVVGEILALDPLVGGPFQMLCPSEGEHGFYVLDAQGQWLDVGFPCTPGVIGPEPDLGFGDAFVWSVGFVRGYVRCPSSGSLDLYFTGGGEPTEDRAELTRHECLAGEPFDVSLDTVD